MTDGEREREPGDSERSPENLQKTLDSWRDTASRVDVGLQCWFRLCGGFKMELSMSIMGNDLQGPIFFFPLLHLASATRLTVDMLRRPTAAEIRREMHAAPLAEPEPPTLEDGDLHIEPETEPGADIADSSGSDGFHSAGDSDGENTRPDKRPALAGTVEADRGHEEDSGDRNDSPVPLAYELEHDDDDFVQPPLQPPREEPAPEPEPEPTGKGGRDGRRTRCPMLVTATQALGPDGSPGGGTSLLPIAVFLESQHVICVVLPASATRECRADNDRHRDRDRGDPFAGFGSASWTFDGQLVALKWNDPGWAVRPLLKTFPAWLQEVIADTKGLAWRSDALYAVD